jgi:hypothetical protein
VKQSKKRPDNAVSITCLSSKQRIGRVKVAHGADAVDGAFATIYGEAYLTRFQVWAYQVNSQEVSVGDPIDYKDKHKPKK